MTGTFEVIGDELKITFEYQGVIATVQSIVGNAAEYLYHSYPIYVDETEEVIPFDDLTNVQKLSIVDKHVRRVVNDAANTFKSIEAQRIAREAEAADEYNL